MKTLVQITAQYYENYGFYNGTESWKPKGSQVFNLRADSDLFLYGEEMCVEAIKVMLEEHCDRLNRFEYISHELVFAEPMELDGDKFESIFDMVSAQFHQNA
jgi:hypothetical protein